VKDANLLGSQLKVILCHKLPVWFRHCNIQRSLWTNGFWNFRRCKTSLSNFN